MNHNFGKFPHFEKDYSWQDRAVEYYMSNLPKYYATEPGVFEKAYMLEVSPSGGKTIFSLKLVKKMIVAGKADFAIWCVPRDSIKHGFQDDCQKLEPLPVNRRKIASRTLQIETDLKNYRGLLKNKHGLVITYQSLNRNMIDYLEVLSRDRRIIFIFDEAHHASGTAGVDDDTANEWGKAMHNCAAFAHSMILMSGTPLRSDNKKLPFVDYQNIEIEGAGDIKQNGFIVKADFSFSYRNAVAAGIARKIIARNQYPIITYEVRKPSGEAEMFERNLNQIPVTHLSKAKSSMFCFTRGKKTVDQFLQDAYEECQRLRDTGDPDAAILVIGSRDSGSRDRQDTNNSLREIARCIQALTGQTPVTVESTDGETARKKIIDFKKSTSYWIVAKEMISEGTNIPRIRIIVLLRDIGNKTFYEQLVHRATRNDADDRPQDAIIIQPGLPKLIEWAKALEEEARIGFDKIKEKNGPGGDGSHPKNEILGISAVPDDESVIIEGDDFTSVDVMGRVIHAEVGLETKTNRYQIDKILKEAQKHKDTFEQEMKNDQPFSIEEQCIRYREEVNNICRRIASQIGGDNPFKRIIGECKMIAGVKESFDKIMREDPEPLEKFRKLYQAALTLQDRYMQKMV